MRALWKASPLCGPRKPPLLLLTVDRTEVERSGVRSLLLLLLPPGRSRGFTIVEERRDAFQKFDD